jgi:hypothetical protein
MITREAADEWPLIGAGRPIIDKATVESSVWPSLPMEMVISQYRERQATRPSAHRAFGFQLQSPDALGATERPEGGAGDA